ncbi:MAG: LysM peptidoglycan-binding domain-containing protein [Anaerolineaceae bacterium]|nr:LysM peptidoglycan-binding domain-containing protein [Anaerolineaceae bacterium]
MKREAEAVQAAATATKAETIYVVKSGDTLSGIAKSVYGNAGRWREIFEANKDVIENPNLIRPGWKLRIPG